MVEILSLALPFFGLIALGVIATRFWRIGEEGLAWLNVFLIYFALPALIFLVIAAAPFEKLIGWPFVTATASVTIAAFLGVFVVSRRLFGTAFKTAALQGTAASYGNVGYMGLPLAVAFFGPEATVPAALVFCFDCAAQSVMTAGLATLAHEDQDEAGWIDISVRVARQVFTHPFIIATILGAAASALQWKIPAAPATILAMLMNAAGPCALFALGVTVGMRKFSKPGREAPLVAVTKLLLQPVLAYAVVGSVPGIDPTWLHVAVMMAALPTASNAFILASQYRAYVEGASTAVILTTAFSAVTIPLIVYAIKAGLLP